MNKHKARYFECKKLCQEKMNKRKWWRWGANHTNRELSRTKARNANDFSIKPATWLLVERLWAGWGQANTWRKEIQRTRGKDLWPRLSSGAGASKAWRLALNIRRTHEHHYQESPSLLSHLRTYPASSQTQLQSFLPPNTFQKSARVVLRGSFWVEKHRHLEPEDGKSIETRMKREAGAMATTGG